MLPILTFPSNSILPTETPLLFKIFCTQRELSPFCDFPKSSWLTGAKKKVIENINQQFQLNLINQDWIGYRCSSGLFPDVKCSYSHFFLPKSRMKSSYSTKHLVKRSHWQKTNQLEVGIYRKRRLQTRGRNSRHNGQYTCYVKTTKYLQVAIRQWTPQFSNRLVWQ